MSTLDTRGTTKRAAIYARVSTDEQAEKGYSLPSQLEACRRYAEQNGLRVVAEFKDDYSGAKLERPEFSKLRDMVRMGELEAVIIYCTDRLTRNLAHSLILRDEFDRAGVERHSVIRGKSSDGAESRMVENIEGVFAEYEREKIRERTMRGKVSAAKNGRIRHGGKPPYGYRYVDGMAIIQPDEADLVRQMYRWYLDGLVDKAIARRFSEMRIPTPYERYPRMGRARVRASCMWGAPSVRRILTSEAYKGQIRFGKSIGYGGMEGKRKVEETIMIKCPPIVSADTWQAAQERRAFNKANSKRNTKRQYLLRGMIRCGKCHWKMGGKSHPARPGKKGYAHYGCGRQSTLFAKIENQCNQPVVRADKVEAIAWDFVYSVLTGDDFEQGLRDAQRVQKEQLSQKHSTLETLQRGVMQCETEMNEYIAMLAQAKGDLMKQAVNGKIAQLEKNYTALAKELERLTSAINEETLTEEQIESALLFRKATLEGLADPTFESKRGILEKLRCEVVMTGKHGVVNLHFPAASHEFELPTPTHRSSAAGQSTQAWPCP